MLEENSKLGSKEKISTKPVELIGKQRKELSTPSAPARSVESIKNTFRDRGKNTLSQ